MAANSQHSAQLKKCILDIDSKYKTCIQKLENEHQKLTIDLDERKDALKDLLQLFWKREKESAIQTFNARNNNISIKNVQVNSQLQQTTNQNVLINRNIYCVPLTAAAPQSSPFHVGMLPHTRIQIIPTQSQLSVTPQRPSQEHLQQSNMILSSNRSIRNNNNNNNTNNLNNGNINNRNINKSNNENNNNDNQAGSDPVDTNITDTRVKKTMLKRKREKRKSMVIGLKGESDHNDNNDNNNNDTTKNSGNNNKNCLSEDGSDQMLMLNTKSRRLEINKNTSINQDDESESESTSSSQSGSVSDNSASDSESCCNSKSRSNSKSNIGSDSQSESDVSSDDDDSDFVPGGKRNTRKKRIPRSRIGSRNRNKNKNKRRRKSYTNNSRCNNGNNNNTNNSNNNNNHKGNSNNNTFTTPMPSRARKNVNNRGTGNGKSTNKKVRQYGKYLISATNPRRCPVATCGKIFDNAMLFSNHLQTHGKCDEIPYQCTTGNCHKVFITRASLHTHKKAHLSSVKGKGVYRCENCKRSFDKHIALVQHRRHAKNGGGKCITMRTRTRTRSKSMLSGNVAELLQRASSNEQNKNKDKDKDKNNDNINGNEISNSNINNNNENNSNGSNCNNSSSKPKPKPKSSSNKSLLKGKYKCRSCHQILASKKWLESHLIGIHRCNKQIAKQTADNAVPLED